MPTTMTNTTETSIFIGGKQLDVKNPQAIFVIAFTGVGGEVRPQLLSWNAEYRPVAAVDIGLGYAAVRHLIQHLLPIAPRGKLEQALRAAARVLAAPLQARPVPTRRRA